MTVAVVLFSGGLDSTTALTEQVRKYGASQVLALSITYGSLHQESESAAAYRICEFLGVKRKVISLPASIYDEGKSALLGQSSMPNEEYHDPEKESPSATIVPFRNAILIAIATAVANSIGALHVYIAAHGNDAVGFAYPDCTPQFLGPMSEAVYYGTLRQVKLMYPYILMTKAGVVGVAAAVRAPLNMTWSCYRGGAVHCGQCPTCLERRKAFHDAGYFDPTKYLDGTLPTYDNFVTPTYQVFPPGERTLS